MTVDLIEYVDSPNAELAREGVMEGLAQSGLVLGKDFELRRHVAQGDMATLSSIIDTALTRRHRPDDHREHADAADGARPRPWHAAGVHDGVEPVHRQRGENRHRPSAVRHRVVSRSAGARRCWRRCREFQPPVRRIGTLYTPAELNAVFNKEQLERGAKAAGLEFEAVAVTSTSDVIEATLSLANRKIDVLTQIADNVTASSFPALMEAARRARLPVTAYSPAFAEMGPILILARDYRDNGVESGRMAARVLRGENPRQRFRSCPFRRSATSSI